MMRFGKRLVICLLALSLTACTEGNRQAQTEGHAEDKPQQVQTEKVVEDKPSQERAETIPDMQRSIVTASQYQTSFRETVGENKEVVFLGKPRDLNAEGAKESSWVSSDESIATVKDGVVTGWREGIVTITQKHEKDVAAEWQFAVTTFNDGRQAELTYEWKPEEIEATLEGEGGILDPAWWQQKLNTIQDVITYLQVSGFAYSADMPVLSTVNSEWLSFVPPEMVMLNGFGFSDDMTNLAAYLLKDDFEDWGYVYVLGDGLKTKTWFYEDGIYYYVDFAQLARDLRADRRKEAYVPARAKDLDELTGIIKESIKVENVAKILLISAQGNDYMPPVYMNYLHDSSAIHDSHVVIGFEKLVMDGAKELFSNPDFDCEVIAMPEEKIPEGLKTYGKKNVSAYAYQ